MNRTVSFCDQSSYIPDYVHRRDSKILDLKHDDDDSSSSSSWLNDDEWKQIASRDLQVAAHAMKQGNGRISRYLKHALYNPNESAKHIKDTILEDYFEKQSNASFNELNVDSMRGIERLISKDFNDDIARIKQRKVKAILAKQEKLKSKGTDLDKMWNELGKLSKQYSSSANDLAVKFGEVDEHVVKVLWNVNRALPMLNELAFVPKTFQVSESIAAQSTSNPVCGSIKSTMSSAFGSGELKLRNIFNWFR